MAARELVELAWLQAWQLAVLIVIVWSAARCFARDRPHLAHALWVVVLLKCLTPPLWSSPTGVFSWLQWQAPAVVEYFPVPTPVPAGSESDAVSFEKPRLVGTVAAEEYAHPVNSADPLPPGLDRWSLALAVWLGGAATFFSVAVLRLALFVHRLSRCPRGDHAELTACVRVLSRRLGVRRPVRVLVTQSHIGPAVIGLLRPIIVLPSLITEGKTSAELEPLIAHELVHVRRGDLFWAAVQTLSTSLWWFHPLVWAASRMVTRETERSCDEEVIAGLACKPAVYAHGLLDVLERKHRLRSAPALPGVRTVDITSSRLERVMRLGQGSHRRTPWWCWMLVVLVGAVALPGAQLMWAKQGEPLTAEPPYFDVDHPWNLNELRKSPVPEGPWDVEMMNVEDVLQRLAEEEGIEGEKAGISLVSLLTLGSLYDPPAEVAERSRNVIVNSDGQSREITLGGSSPRARIVDGTLYVFDSLQRRQHIRAAVDRLRKHGFSQIVVTTRFVSAREGEFERFGVRWSVAESTIGRPGDELADASSSEGGDSLLRNEGPLSQKQRITAKTIIETSSPVLYSVLDAPQSRRLLEWAQANERTNVVRAPRVTVFNGQRVDINDLSQRPFVTGLTRVPHENGELSDAFQPIIRVVEEGTRLRLRPALGEDERVSLACSVTFSSVRKVETVAIPQGAGIKAPMIQVPEVASTTIASALDIPLGATLAISGHRPHSASRKAEVLMLLITCEKVGPGPAISANAAPNEFSRYVSFPDPRTSKMTNPRPEVYSRIPIEGSEVQAGDADSNSPPADKTLINALLRSGQLDESERRTVEENVGTIRIVKEKIADYHDPLREGAGGKRLRQHHMHYKCTFILPVDAASDRQKADATQYVLYIDHHHNHLVSK